LIVIVWVMGFAGVIALTIHSMAALGKLYWRIEHIDPGPVGGHSHRRTCWMMR
jgi:ABC-type phosphate/phosphonate transport system permease subunit